MDINKVWVSGVAITAPIYTKIGARTPFSSFTLQVNEQFVDKNNNVRVKPNLLRIESLGKSAEATANKVVPGIRYQVDGYLRQDEYNGQDDIKIRTFAVYKEESLDTFHHSEGIRQAIEILKKSIDVTAAVKTLENLLDSF
jgi:single-stranded DNA-binding protein